MPSVAFFLGGDNDIVEAVKDLTENKSTICIFIEVSCINLFLIKKIKNLKGSGGYADVFANLINEKEKRRKITEP